MTDFELDFETAKGSIITYLKSKEEFKDYNYTGSAISTLIDALAYISVTMGTYANYAMNESFLDTAQGRKAVVSKAKALGYIPYQKTCAKVHLRMTYIGAGSPSSIPAGTTFLGQKSGSSSFTFQTKQAYTDFDYDESTYTWFTDIVATEGTEYTEKWTQDAYGTTKFIIQNTDIDIDDMKVTVDERGSSNVAYSQIESTDDIGSDCKSYYYIENASGNIELIFGDGTLARKLEEGDVVYCTVRTSSGTEANGITNFSLMYIEDSNLSDWKVEAYEAYESADDNEILTYYGSYGGGDRETIESIKAQSVLIHQRQNRNVTANDYKTAILAEYGGSLSGVACWGGEENDPPMYGKIMISMQPSDRDYVSTSFANEVTAFLKEKSIVTIEPVYVRPEVIYVTAKAVAYYYKKNFTIGESAFKTRISNSIKSYFSTFSSDVFEANIYYSDLISTILNNTGSYVRSVDVDFTLAKRVQVKNNNTVASYEIDFKNPIKEGSVNISKWFQVGLSSGYGRIVDDKNGHLKYYRVDYAYDDESVMTETLTLLNSNVGTVDYTNGIVYINNFTFYLNGESYVTMTCEPASPSISTSKNNMFNLSEINVTVTGV